MNLRDLRKRARCAEEIGNYVGMSQDAETIIVRSKGKKMLIVDDTSNFHPYECGGKGNCKHCDRRIIYDRDKDGELVCMHHPSDCALCDPGYDGGLPFDIGKEKR